MFRLRVWSRVESSVWTCCADVLNGEYVGIKQTAHWIHLAVKRLFKIAASGVYERMRVKEPYVAIWDWPCWHAGRQRRQLRRRRCRRRRRANGLVGFNNRKCAYLRLVVLVWLVRVCVCVLTCNRGCRHAAIKCICATIPPHRKTCWLVELSHWLRSIENQSLWLVSASNILFYHY